MKQSSANAKMELHIRVNYKQDALFKCPDDNCHELCQVKDSVDQMWRHLKFFQFKAFITARVPMIKCKDHGLKSVEVPLLLSNSGFTLIC